MGLAASTYKAGTRECFGVARFLFMLRSKRYGSPRQKVSWCPTREGQRLQYWLAHYSRVDARTCKTEPKIENSKGVGLLRELDTGNSGGEGVIMLTGSPVSSSSITTPRLKTSDRSSKRPVDW